MRILSGRETCKPKQNALLIQTKDISYTDLLKSVETAVDPSEIGVQIKT